MRVVAIVGAGLSGAVVARGLADRGLPCHVFEREDTVGGACKEIVWHGHLVPAYGPHIFRTRESAIWRFMERFQRLAPVRHHVAAQVGGALVPFPPVRTCAHPLPSSPRSSYTSVGDYLVAAVGRQTFRAYYDAYTVKRWGVSAFELSPELIPLIPVFRHDGGFFSESLVGIPILGYSELIMRLLDSPLIRVELKTSAQSLPLNAFRSVVWTARLDSVPNVPGDALPYRCLSQTLAADGAWPHTDIAVINYPDRDTPFLRRTNYQLLLPSAPPVIGTEFAGWEGYPAYPLPTRQAADTARAITHAVGQRWPALILHGRLGEYRYMSMDQAVASSLRLASQIASSADTTGRFA